jgi:xylulokinase
MLLLGIDVGTSSVKASVVDGHSQKLLATAQYPDVEADITAEKPGWAEQSPHDWWHFVQQAIQICHQSKAYHPHDIGAIGIAYQMHGLVLVNENMDVLRPAIIWCDSRAIAVGNQAFEALGRQNCLTHLLNSPGNFTASKLAWVKQNEPDLFARVHKAMLPGDFIALKMTGTVTTTVSALSEGMFWDFKRHRLSAELMAHFGFSEGLLPTVTPVFSSHGGLSPTIAAGLALKAGIPVAYKAGDQLNNALTTNVMQPGEVATTAGTSGVIYGVSNQLCHNNDSRINTFAHVNHAADDPRTGVLLCINGTGIFNRWMRQVTGSHQSYAALNALAACVPTGSQGLMALPFGNGAERMFNNKLVGAHFSNIDFNTHTTGHLVRAAQEGVAFSMRYGLDLMRKKGLDPAVVRASKANLFLSDSFTQAFAGVNRVAVEFFDGDGSFGAALGAGLGVGFYRTATEALGQRHPIGVVEPRHVQLYEDLYGVWQQFLQAHLALAHM